MKKIRINLFYLVAGIGAFCMLVLLYALVSMCTVYYHRYLQY